MRLVHRFFQLAKADAHGVLDSVEDRGLVLKQCLREAELEVERKRARKSELAERIERQQRDAEHLRQRAQVLDADIRLAMEGDQESLTRFSIRRWLANQKRSEHAALERRELEAELNALSSTLEQQEAELSELRQQVELELQQLRAHRPHATHKRVECEIDPSAAVRDEEVELEWLRRREAGARS